MKSDRSRQIPFERRVGLSASERITGLRHATHQQRKLLYDAILGCSSPFSADESRDVGFEAHRMTVCVIASNRELLCGDAAIAMLEGELLEFLRHPIEVAGWRIKREWHS